MKKKTTLATLCLVTLVAGTTFADVQVLDDSIITGSQCVGLDCSSGYSFGFNTLVLRQNNVRILFQDTSTSSSFPTTDWMLEANESTNGGTSHFAIVNVDAGTTPFFVDRSAPHGALTVNESGLGVGVEPATDVHVMTADTPVFRIEQNGTQGWAPAAWDMGANESNFFIRDVSNATVPFRISPAAVNDAVVVEPNGDLSVAGVVNEGSSRAIKFGVVPVDPSNVLQAVAAMEVSRWRYVSDDKGAEHMGPMAEDFHRTFGLGADDRHIAALDLAGVAVSSVQALNSLVEQQAQELEVLKTANTKLEARLARLEALLAAR